MDEWDKKGQGQVVKASVYVIRQKLDVVVRGSFEVLQVYIQIQIKHRSGGTH